MSTAGWDGVFDLDSLACFALPWPFDPEPLPSADAARGAAGGGPADFARRCTGPSDAAAGAGSDVVVIAGSDGAWLGAPDRADAGGVFPVGVTPSPSCDPPPDEPFTRSAPPRARCAGRPGRRGGVAVARGSDAARPGVIGVAVRATVGREPDGPPVDGDAGDDGEDGDGEDGEDGDAGAGDGDDGARSAVSVRSACCSAACPAAVDS